MLLSLSKLLELELPSSKRSPNFELPLPILLSHGVPISHSGENSACHSDTLFESVMLTTLFRTQDQSFLHQRDITLLLRVKTGWLHAKYRFFLTIHKFCTLPLTLS